MIRVLLRYITTSIIIYRNDRLIEPSSEQEINRPLNLLIPPKLVVVNSFYIQVRCNVCSRSFRQMSGYNTE